MGLMLGSLRSPESSELQSDEPVSFFRGLKLVMNHGAYIKLITGFLFTSLAFMVSAAGLRGQGEPSGRLVGARWAGDLVGEQPLGSARGWGSPPDRSVPPLQLLEGNFALFCTYTLGFRNEFQNILLVIMVRTLPPEPPKLGRCPWWHPASPRGLARGGRPGAAGTATEGPPGAGEGEGAAECPAKAVLAGRNSTAFVPT